jgi:hypothetical protein
MLWLDFSMIRIVQARTGRELEKACARTAVRITELEEMAVGPIDHDCDWDLGGATNGDNLHALCRKHHNFKTKKRWHVDVNPDGSETWTSVLGFRYTKRVKHYLIVPLDPPQEDEPPDESDEVVLRGDLDPPYPTESVPEPPPLDAFEIEELHDALCHGWGGCADRVYDVLHAAELVG